MASKMTNDPEGDLSGLVPRPATTTERLIYNPSGQSPEQIRLMNLLERKHLPEQKIDDFIPDPDNVLFEPRVLQNDAEKAIYKEVLQHTVLNALGVAFKEDTKLHGIYKEIREAKAADQNTSLFLEINTRLEQLVEGAQLVEADGQLIEQPIKIGGQDLTDEEREQGIKGLRLARRILIRAAKTAGVFESLNRQIEQIEQDPNHDYEQNIKNVEELKENPSRLEAEETLYNNRASPDFGGISAAYIDGAAFNMEYYLAKAEVKHFGEKADLEAKLAERESNPTKKAKHIARNSDYLRQANNSKDILDELEDDRFIRNWGKPRPNLKNRALLYLKDKERTEEFKESKRKPLEEDEEYTKHMGTRNARSGYNGVVQGVETNGRINPEVFDQSLTSEWPPTWYENLPPEYQRMVKAVLHLNWMAANKIAEGPVSFENWATAKGLRVERRDLKDMFEKMPGFRIALRTLTNDFFDADQKEFRIRAGQEGKGYDLFKNQEVLNAYKEEKINLLALHFKTQPEALDWATKHFGAELAQAQSLMTNGNNENGQKIIDSVYRKIASVSVHTSYNLLFATGAIDSGNQFADFLFEPDAPSELQNDERYQKMSTAHKVMLDRFSREEKERHLSMDEDQRKRYEETLPGKINGSQMASDAVRTLFQPGQKIADKSKEGTGWGALGPWIEDNLRHNREVPGTGGVRFGDAMKMTEETMAKRNLTGEQKNKIREIKNYIPRRFFFSMLEETELVGKRESLAEILLKSETANISIKVPVKVTGDDGVERIEEGEVVGLYDYTRGAEHVDLSKIKVDELYGDYQDLMSAVVKVYEHMTSTDPRKGRLGQNELINALIKLKKDRKLREEGIFTNEAFLKAAVGLLISPEGFEEGQPELLLKLPGAYNVLVTSALQDTRLFMGLANPREMRKKLFETYNAHDTTSTLAFLWEIYTGGTIFEARERKFRGLRKKIAQEIAEQEELMAQEEVRRRARQVQTTSQTP